ncbi:MAG: GGDEF domain-containing protein [Lachnospiraceae bacterium]|nr:GGDEF domain-containing protein [Lachnospiraceae bacterium]
MKTIALIVGSIIEEASYSLVNRIRKEYAGDAHIILLPVGIAKRAIRAENRADFLYFLEKQYADEVLVVPDDTIDLVFLSALRGRLKELDIPLRVLDDLPVQEKITKEAKEWKLRSSHLIDVTMGKLFGVSEKFLAADHVEEISEAMGELLLTDSFICMRDSFLQDIFADRGPAPNSYEKFYVLADSRQPASTWDTYPLSEFFPDARETLDEFEFTTVIPVHCRQAYFGYLIHSSHELDEVCRALELLAVVLDLMISRYITEKKLSFANNELVNANENVQRLQETDVLTGLRNSVGFMREAKELLSHALVTGQRICTVCVDLDRLGNINEIYGHLEGDIAIQMLAQILLDSLRPGMLAARLGSDEFIVLMPADDMKDVSEEFSDHVKNRVQTYNHISGKEYTLEANISCLTITPNAKTGVEDILDEAFTKKRLLKDSRSSRRGSGLLASDNDDLQEHGVVRDIMDENAFLYAFQPIVSARTGEVVAYEALMRTQQEPKLSPLTILKYAGMDERLYEIELSTFSNVLRQVDHFKEDLEDKKIFINSIPGHYLTDEDYGKLKQRYGHLFSHLVVEITEETEFESCTADILRARSTADHFEVAVDDFGTGYSNMSNLLKFLPNYVKIDRTLIENVQEDPKKQHFVKTIIEFAHDNGFQALAEGVETSRELSAVVRMGVDFVQGYYTARPGFALSQTISSTIRDEIVRANFEGAHDLRKKVYLVNREKELFLMHLAMERYTSIILSQPELTLHGNPDFMAGLNIKIKENCNCTLRISNVRLGDNDHFPCIDIGRGASLTLILEGNNELEGNGIHVPEDSSLRLEGDGNLSITPVLSDAYCLGAAYDATFGHIECAMTGILALNAEGNHCVGIGGGRCQSGDGIRISSGRLDLIMAGTECVCIGSYKGEVPISITEADVNIEVRSAHGMAVGAFHGRQNIEIRDVSMEIVGSGSTVIAIGNAEETGGSIRVDCASIHLKGNGRTLYMLGCEGGKPDISVSKSNLDILVEGNRAVAMGSMKEDATLRLIETTVGIVMRVGEPMALGVAKDQLLVVAGTHHMSVNEKDSDF